MSARPFTIVMDQGSDYILSIPVLNSSQQAVDVTEWVVRGQVRQRHVADTPQELDVTVEDDAVTLRIPAATSSAWTFRAARYDIEITSPDGLATTRLIEGLLVVRPEVTRV